MVGVFTVLAMIAGLLILAAPLRAGGGTGEAEQIFIVFADADPTFSDCPTGEKSKQNVERDTDRLLVCTADENGQPAGTEADELKSIQVLSSDPSIVFVINEVSETDGSGIAIAEIEAAGPGSAQVEAELRCSGNPETECPAGTNVEGIVDEDVVSKNVIANTGSPPECSDEVDNDDDGRVDLEDPGCEGPDDNSEDQPVIDRRAVSSVTIRYDRDDTPPAFKGHVTPGRKPCRRHRLVVLFKTRPGQDSRQGYESTNRTGDYRIRKGRARGRWYVRVTRAVRTAPNGDFLICLRGRSVTIRVRRRG